MKAFLAKTNARPKKFGFFLEQIHNVLEQTQANKKSPPYKTAGFQVKKLNDLREFKRLSAYQQPVPFYFLPNHKDT